MKFEPTIVPKKKCPLDLLADLGEQTGSSWIFLHQDVINRIIDTADEVNWTRSEGLATCKFFESEDTPITEVNFEFSNPPSDCHVWAWVNRISAIDIAFTSPPKTPENIFFLKMEE